MGYFRSAGSTKSGGGRREYFSSPAGEPFVPPETNILFDQFTTDDASPVATPRTAEPGPGALVLTQADGTWAIASSRLAFTAQASASTADLAAYFSTSQTRAAGLAMAVDLNLSTTGNWYVGWWNSTTINNSPRGGLRGSAGTLQARLAGSNVNVGSIATGNDYRFAIVLGAAGSWLLAKGGGFSSTYKLLLREFSNADATLYSAVANDSAVGSFDNWKIPIAGVTIAELYANSGNLSSGTQFDLGEADTVIDFKVTASNPLTAGYEFLGFRLDGAGTTGMLLERELTTGNLNLRPVVAGTPGTILNTQASVWTAGSTRYVQVRMNGTKYLVTTRTTKTGVPTVAFSGEVDPGTLGYESNHNCAILTFGAGVVGDVVAFAYDQGSLGGL